MEIYFSKVLVLKNSGTVSLVLRWPRDSVAMPLVNLYIVTSSHRPFLTGAMNAQTFSIAMRHR